MVSKKGWGDKKQNITRQTEATGHSTFLLYCSGLPGLTSQVVLFE